MIFFFSPLKNKAEREKSWLSGSFYKQWHDKKHMALQHQDTGSFAAPWRSIRPSVTLREPLDARNPTFQSELMGGLAKLVTWEQTGRILRLELRHWLGAIFWPVTREQIST